MKDDRCHANTSFFVCNRGWKSRQGKNGGRDKVSKDGKTKRARQKVGTTHGSWAAEKKKGWVSNFGTASSKTVTIWGNTL